MELILRFLHWFMQEMPSIFPNPGGRACASFFEANQFDIVLCHYLLLWVQKPIKVIREMIRITKPGGLAVIVAEPDYKARIDLPIEMEKAGAEQTASLIEQGIDPTAGRNLLAWMKKAGAVNPLLGIRVGSEYQGDEFVHFLEQESAQLVSDTGTNCGAKKNNRRCPPAPPMNPIAEQLQFLYIPTFYAIICKQ